ncbi:hypothetical protein LEP1GSC121_1346 [Leptospira borgpetersenii serovar Castellonis str. 200801910]|nr:hypothetical protein LEP1GSC121_1346 [Leptospira borgpetersenii serovar Castellonis str. 200801910]
MTMASIGMNLYFLSISSRSGMVEFWRIESVASILIKTMSPKELK